MSEESLPSSPIRVHSDEEAEIAALAYRFYCEEGCPEGKADEHWLRAEQEVRGKSSVREFRKFASGSFGRDCSGRESSARRVSFPRIPCERRPHSEGLGAEVARAFRLAGSERVENAIFLARSVLVEKYVGALCSLGGASRRARLFCHSGTTAQPAGGLCVRHLKVVAAKIRIHRLFTLPIDRDNLWRAEQNVGPYERRSAHCPRREHSGHHHGRRSRHPTLPVDERESEAGRPARW